MWVTATAGQVIGSDAQLVQTSKEDLDRTLAASLDEHGSWALEEVAGCHPLPAT